MAQAMNICPPNQSQSMPDFPQCKPAINSPMPVPLSQTHRGALILNGKKFKINDIIWCLT